MSWKTPYGSYPSFEGTLSPRDVLTFRSGSGRPDPGSWKFSEISWHSWSKRHSWWNCYMPIPQWAGILLNLREYFHRNTGHAVSDGIHRQRRAYSRRNHHWSPERKKETRRKLHEGSRSFVYQEKCKNLPRIQRTYSNCFKRTFYPQCHLYHCQCPWLSGVRQSDDGGRDGCLWRQCLWHVQRQEWNSGRIWSKNWLSWERNQVKSTHSFSKAVQSGKIEH